MNKKADLAPKGRELGLRIVGRFLWELLEKQVYVLVGLASRMIIAKLLPLTPDHKAL